MTHFESPGLIDGMCKTLLAASKDDRLRTFVLVDGALLRDLPIGTRRFWASLNGQSLLTGASDEVGAVGPLLYSITQEADKTRLPASLCDPKSGRIAGSFIFSDREPGELAKKLSALVDVHLSDGTGMVMRFFDPRVLPFWLETISPRYNQYIAGTVVQWISWLHDFSVQTLHFDRTAQTQPSIELPMKMTLNVENALMNACFPFTMIERMRAEDAAALDRVEVPQRYAFFREQIERAQAHGLSAQGELEAYCGTAIEFGAGFDEDVQVRAALAGIQQGQTFDEALATLTSDDWQRVRGVP